MKTMKTMKMQLIGWTAAAALLFGAAACGSQAGSAAAQPETAAETGALEVDALLADAESLTDQPVVVEGVCTHVCKHGATKLFLMGSDDTQIIRVEAADLGSFDTKCVHRIVRVEGILREQRIDEAYLQRWESQIASAGGELHGEDEAGCASEMKARQERASTPEGRIADFRQRIGERQLATGKDYLSFYFVEASGYTIE